MKFNQIERDELGMACSMHTCVSHTPKKREINTNIDSNCDKYYNSTCPYGFQSLPPILQEGWKSYKTWLRTTLKESGKSFVEMKPLANNRVQLKGFVNDLCS
jgi:hypothetical protein